jgi:putative transposase
MLMNLTHKTEFYPTIKQKEMISKMFGFRRLIFNKSLELLIDEFGNLKKNKKLIKKSKLVDFRDNIYRKEEYYTSLLKQIPNQIIDTALEDLLTALQSLWKNGKEIKYRCKKSQNTARIYKKNDFTFKNFPNQKYIKIVKLGKLELAEPLRWTKCNIKLTTFKYEAGKYFISIVVELDPPKKLKKTHRHIGFDWGLKTFLTGFDGQDTFEFDYDKNTIKKLDNRINKMHKKLSKHKEDSNNYEKARTKLQTSYMNRTNYQEDLIKKLASELVKKYDYVTLEGLRMSFVFKNKHLSKKAGEKMFYRAKKIIYDKFKQYGKKIYELDNKFPSTQMCSKCGNIKKNDDKMKLSNRIYECSCGLKINRDYNAARNIYNSPYEKEIIL